MCTFLTKGTKRKMLEATDKQLKRLESRLLKKTAEHILLSSSCSSILWEIECFSFSAMEDNFDGFQIEEEEKQRRATAV